jgi:acetyl-CoA C-acetyltransferase
MSLDPRTPVMIGVGQLNRRPETGVDAPEPVDLMADALRLAADDAGAPSVLGAADSVMVPRPLSWRYRDPGALLAERVGASPRQTVASVIGGNYGQTLANRAASQIQAGETDVVLVAGADAWRTNRAAKAEGRTLPWTRQSDDVAPTVDLGVDQPEMSLPAERERGVVHPIEVYPMFDLAVRAAAGRAPDEHLELIAGLWSRFSEVAATNPHAWLRESFTPAEIATPSADNRLIGYPYTKRMNSNNAVEQAAAVIVCSVEQATALGIARERWVFPHAGADAHDHWHLSERADLHSSPALRACGRDLFALAGVGPDDLDHVDLYSCFPSAVQIAAAELGLTLDRPLTVTGGMSFAGGPWNSYVLHGIATMVERLRAEPGLGLCNGNGGYTTKHSVAVYGTEPPAAGFRHAAPQDEVDASPRRELAAGFDGEVVVEAYTVMHARDGSPERGPVAGLTDAGCRAWGSVVEVATLAEMVNKDVVGRRAHLAPDGTINL